LDWVIGFAICKVCPLGEVGFSVCLLRLELFLEGAALEFFIAELVMLAVAEPFLLAEEG